MKRQRLFKVLGAVAVVGWGFVIAQHLTGVAVGAMLGSGLGVWAASSKFGEGISTGIQKAACDAALYPDGKPPEMK